MAAESIKDMRLFSIPLSTGTFSVGILTELAGGVSEWDGSPIGITTVNTDPVNIHPYDANEVFLNLRRTLIGQSALNQEAIDALISEAVGQDAAGLRAVNLAIAVSCSVARAGAAHQQVPLYKYLSRMFDTRPRIPGVMCNILGGGGHHSNQMKTTELMVIAHSFDTGTLYPLFAVRQQLKTVLEEKSHSLFTGIEGSWVASDLDDDEAISALVHVLNSIEPRLDMSIGLDMAGAPDSGLVSHLLGKYPHITYVEDPFPVEDASHFGELLRRYPTVRVAGDDLIGGRIVQMSKLLRSKSVNTIVIKLNHAGTVSRIFEAVNTVKTLGGITVVSQRSQETGKDTLSHLAVASAADYIKAGFPVRERISNYSNLVALQRALNK